MSPISRTTEHARANGLAPISPSGGHINMKELAVPKTDRVRTKVQPGPRNCAAMAEAAQQFLARPIRVAVRWEMNETGEVKAASPHTDDLGHNAQLVSAFGSTSHEFMAIELARLEWATRDRAKRSCESDGEANAGLALIQAVGPQDELEAALAVQMASCHALTMEMLGRAKSTDSTESMQLYGNLAVKLQRTFTAQVEALARLRGKGQQVVRVEHVTVAPGAQAVIGDVHHHQAGGGVTHNQETQPHGTRSAAASAALPSPDPTRNSVPIPGDAERPVPNARRRVAGRSPRQSKRP